MNYIVSGKNIEVTNALKENAVHKMGRLEKFFHEDTDAHLTMSVQKTRQIIEVTIPFNGIMLRAEESSNDMYASIDKVVDVLERQIRRNKTRLSKRTHGHPLKFESLPQIIDEVEEEHDFDVIRSKKFAIKPMNTEEAILQMNLLGHEFFMFSNAKTKEVNVVYKRKDGNYGLIEPEF